jgi:hypothetical protein
MRAGLIVWTIIGLGASASFADPKEVDLDSTAEATQRLAEAAGACANSLPSYIKLWCGQSTPPPHRFAKRYRGISVTRWGAGLLWFTVPIEEHGKGYLFSITAPEVQCDADTCVYHPTTNVYVKAALDAALIAKVTEVVFTFQIDGMFRMRQWWSPRPSAIKATLLDAAGKRLGEGTVFAKLASP